MDLNSIKNLGVIGSILIVIAPILISITSLGLGLFPVLIGIIGWVLVLIALKKLSNHYRDASIFKNALYGVIVGVVGVVVTIAAMVARLLSVLSMKGIALTDVTSLDKHALAFSSLTKPGVLWNPILALIVPIVVVFLIFSIVSAIFFRRSLRIISTKTRVDLFDTAGLVMLIGACLTIIMVGVFVIWVAWMLVAVGFFLIKTKK